MSWLPNAPCTLVVIDTASPFLSTIEKWLVDGRSAAAVGAKFQAATPAGAPGFTAGSARVKSIAAARAST